VVLKPLSSAGSDGVFFASSEEEVREAFDVILSSSNVFGERNTSVLVQVRMERARGGGGGCTFDSIISHSPHSLPPSLPPPSLGIPARD
jgi:biotin carboxylase